ncbi:MAG TPA: ATP-binding protein [Opitutaceae bacterium]|jgi:PAS domain S-box-containing protein|nr:ATP-binding protein [Opitutaceae bacterium]
MIASEFSLASTSAPNSDPEAQAELERALVQAFLEHVPDRIYFKDRESRFIAVSRSKALSDGLSDPQELIGKTDADLFSGNHWEQSRRDELRIMETGVPVLNKLERLTWTDGRAAWVRCSKMALRNESGDIIGTYGITEDITHAREMEESLEKAQRDLIDASRYAGMAEVATGVLHNVGNVLNSLNVSAAVIGATLRQSKVDNLAKVVALLGEHRPDLAAFVEQDPKGKLIPGYVLALAGHLAEERAELLRELESLQQNIDHIKEIVSMQQAYATMAGVVEPLAPAALVEDALRMNAAALVRHDVSVVRDFAPAPLVAVERGKVLQILINLIRNAKYAIDDGANAERLMTLRIAPLSERTVRITVQDTGIGIPRENLTRIFSHGFTTRRGGHGFGLHSSALAAKEMGGALQAESDGPGSGARFHLDLPVAEPAPAP